MQHKHALWIAALAIGGWSLMPAPAFAQAMEQAEQQTEQAGENLEQAGEDLGQAAEITAQETAQETEQGLQELGQETEQGLEQAGQEMEQAGQQMETEFHQDADALDRAAQTAELTLPAGIQAKEAEDPQAIREPIREAAKAALIEDGFNDVVERLVDEDRNRIGTQIDNLDRQALNARTVSLREAWKAKYGQELDVQASVLENVPVVVGEINDPQQLAGNWPVQAPGAEAMPAGLQQQPADLEQRQEDANLERGREVALAQIQVPGQQPLTVSLVDEAFGWKIDVPNDMNALRIYQGLSSHLGELDNNQQAWPADVNEAQRQLAYRVIAALYGQPVQQDPAINGQRRIEQLREELQQQPMSPQQPATPTPQDPMQQPAEQDPMGR